jgi:P pilus assembly chaperone PapD
MVRQCSAGACALLLLFVSAAAAQVKAVSLRVEVPAGKWKAVRLRNLPKDAVVAVRAETSGEVMLAFLDAEDYKRFPTPTRPLFNGRVEKRIAFAIRMPGTGDYFVVLDNRFGKEPQTVSVRIQAARGTPKKEPKKEPGALAPT